MSTLEKKESENRYSKLQLLQIENEKQIKYKWEEEINKHKPEINNIEVSV